MFLIADRGDRARLLREAGPPRPPGSDRRSEVRHVIGPPILSLLEPALERVASQVPPPEAYGQRERQRRASEDDPEAEQDHLPRDAELGERHAGVEPVREPSEGARARRAA